MKVFFVEKNWIKTIKKISFFYSQNTWIFLFLISDFFLKINTRTKNFHNKAKFSKYYYHLGILIHGKK